jgi:MerR family transcriptional regulator, mercuric resistance operon regulatory protein
VKAVRYRVGEIAKLCGVNKETLRYYERIGLIPEPSRTESGYRMYPEDMVNRLMFIKRMQELGFTLTEIHKLFGVVDRDDVRCIDMYDFVSQKIEEVQAKIQDLMKLENMLQDLKSRCPDEKAIHECPIIESLLDDNKGGIES